MACARDGSREGKVSGHKRAVAELIRHQGSYPPAATPQGCNYGLWPAKFIFFDTANWLITPSAGITGMLGSV